ncbi:MAG: tetratricopeptide repeat protein [Ignavibacteriaceae bacterium]
MPDVSITVDSHIIGTFRIEVQNIWGESNSLYPSLSILYSLNLKPRVFADQPENINSTSLEENYSMLNFTGDLYFVVKQNLKYKIANFSSDQIMNYSTGYELSHSFSIPLDYYRLKQLEEKRKGNLPIEFHFRALLGKHPRIPVNSKLQRENSIKELFKSEFNLNLEIPESVWIENILNKTGYANIKLIEVPIPKKIVPPIYQQALKELEEANKYYNEGDYDKSISHCRRAIEIIPNAIQTDFGKENPSYNFRVKSFLDQHLSTFLSKPKRDSMHSILTAIWNLSSVQSHSSPLEYFSRSDAEALIVISSVMLSYIGRGIESLEVKIIL